MADARSIISLLLLCATVGTLIDIEVHGEDEDAAISAIEQLFLEDSPGSALSPDTRMEDHEERES